MSDPTKALADAARTLADDILQGLPTDEVRKMSRPGNRLDMAANVADALAAYDAAQATEQVPPTDEEVEAWRHKVFGTRGNDVSKRQSWVMTTEAFEEAIALMRRARPNDTHADTREGWEWREEVFRLRKDKEALLQAAKEVVDGRGRIRKDVWLVPDDDIAALIAEVERASKGGAA